MSKGAREEVLGCLAARRAEFRIFHWEEEEINKHGGGTGAMRCSGRAPRTFHEAPPGRGSRLDWLALLAARPQLVINPSLLKTKKQSQAVQCMLCTFEVRLRIMLWID
jgi:hypothetical protein